MAKATTKPQKIPTVSIDVDTGQFNVVKEDDPRHSSNFDSGSTELLELLTYKRGDGGGYSFRVIANNPTEKEAVGVLREALKMFPKRFLYIHKPKELKFHKWEKAIIRITKHLNNLGFSIRRRPG